MAHFGIDVGSRSIKVVSCELGSGQVSPKLISAGAVGLTSPLSLSHEQEVTRVAEVIKKLLMDTRIKSKEAVVALPEAQAYTRLIKFPLLTDQEISSAVKWEAEQYIPIPAADAVIQHQIVARREQPGVEPPGVDVLLVAAPKVLVEKYVKLLQAVGVNVLAAETELLSLVRALAPRDGTSMIIDFGASSTDLAIAKNGQLVFSRSIPTAGEAFTRAVAQGLGVESKQAEEYKRAYGLSASQLEGKIKGAIDPIFRIVGDEIKKAIHFYQTDLHGDSPGVVILSGGTSGLPDIVSELAKQVGVEVVIGDPFQGIAIDPSFSKSLAGYGPLYAIATGLALWRP